MLSTLSFRSLTGCLEGGGLDTSETGPPSNLFSFSHSRNTSRLDRARLHALRDATASSIGSKRAPELWFPVSDENPETGAGVATHPRMGIGLPLSNIFAT
jgi:pyruvate dehydrogenase kinase 2/3/4